MFTKRMKLFSLFGFKVSVDLSWLVIVVLVTWSLAVGVFPQMRKGEPALTYWLMGFAGAMGLFVSIILHELSHSLVARLYGLPIRGITLFIFGGVAEMEEEPPSPGAEFSTAIAGPAASVTLAGLFFIAAWLARRAGLPFAVTGILEYLSLINLALAVFNLLPAFPLDGGRVLRCALWKWKRNLRWATHVSSDIGAGFGAALMVLGIVNAIMGAFISGVWWFMIGMFLRSSSRMSYRRLLFRRAFEGEPVRRFMETSVITVTPDTTVSDLVDHYVYRHHFKMFPVVADGRLVGRVTTREIKNVPREQWPQRRVEDIMAPCAPDSTISPDMDAMHALSRMSRSETSRLMVVDHGGLVGIISLKDLLQFLAIKMDLEGDETAAREE
ncbi:CBS domain-containing protein [bacterium]|nr:CBS domain-containing protein [bacterium]